MLADDGSLICTACAILAFFAEFEDEGRPESASPSSGTVNGAIVKDEV